MKQSVPRQQKRGRYFRGDEFAQSSEREIIVRQNTDRITDKKLCLSCQGCRFFTNNRLTRKKETNVTTSKNYKKGFVYGVNSDYKQQIICIGTYDETCQDRICYNFVFHFRHIGHHLSSDTLFLGKTRFDDITFYAENANKAGSSLNIVLSFSAASSLLRLPLPRNFRQTKRVLPQVCCRFFFLYTPLESSTGWPEQLKRRIFTKKNILLQTSGTFLSLKAPKHDCP